jgi:hypothetical protein
MARSRYSQSELFKKALKLTGGKGVAKRVVPISAKKTGFDTNEGMYADILAQLGGAYSDKLADKLDKADLGAARRMRDDYLKPQKDWNVETDGTTPDALRAATMPGALTGNVGATYDPNVKPFPGEDLYDGTDTAQGMAAALGAPNAALGSPLDPGQAYAVGTDEEGDDANWMNPEEHKAFYENEALNAQAGFDKENPTGMARVDQGNYGVAEPQSLLGQVFGGPAPVSKEQTNTLAMRDLLMGDTIAKRENKEALAQAIATRDEKRIYEAGREGKQFGQEKELKQLEITAKGSKYGTPYRIKDQNSSTGYSLERINQNGKTEILGEAPSPVKMYNPNQSEEEANAKISNLRYETSDAAFVSANESVAILNQMSSLSSGVPNTGAGAALKIKVMSWASSFGIPVNEEELGTAEGMRSLTMKFVLKLVKETKGAISEKEMAAFEAASAGLGNSQRGNEIIIKMALSLANRTKAMSSAVKKLYGNDPRAGRVALDDARDLAGEKFGPLWTPVTDAPEAVPAAQWAEWPVARRYKFLKAGFAESK